MATERIIPTDWSRSTTSSDHTQITDYSNALENVDSTTYGYWFWYTGDRYSYIKFSKSDLPLNVGATAFKIKAARSGGGSFTVKSTVEYNGETYESDTVTVSTNTITTYDIALPDGISPVMLKSATAIYLTLYFYSGSTGELHVYGAEMDVDATAYKIFNLILPREVS